MNILQSPHFPQTHVLSRIFSEKTFFPEEMTFERQLVKSKRCLLQRDPSLEGLLKSQKVFFLGSQTSLNFVLAFMVMFDKVREKGIWISGESLFEYSLVGYYSRRHFYNRQRYDNMWVSPRSFSAHNSCKSKQIWAFFLFLFQKSGFGYLESGLFDNVKQCQQGNSEITAGYNLKVFKGISEFVGSKSGFSNLVLGNFRTIFVGYFAICSLIFLAFCLHHLVVFLQKNKRNKRKRNRIHVEDGVIVTSMPRAVRRVQQVQKWRNRYFRSSVPKSPKFSLRIRISKSKQRTNKVTPLRQSGGTWIRPK